MRIAVQLPKVEPNKHNEPEECPNEDCAGRHFKLHGVEKKAIRDLGHQTVKSLR